MGICVNEIKDMRLPCEITDVIIQPPRHEEDYTITLLIPFLMIIS